MKEEIDFIKIQDFIYEQKSLNDNSVHGLDHWNQVEFNGVFLSEKTKADISVVRLFALFHDSRRISDGRDIEHGNRGAELALKMRGVLFDLDDARFSLLYHACKNHTTEISSGNITIDTCYDADRLDLGRVGLYLEENKMATSFGKKLAALSVKEKISPFQMRPWLKSLKIAKL